MDRNDSRLVHYTSSAQAVGSIMRNGFLLVPNKRNLINAFLGQSRFTDREPQEFGMVSFTQLPIDRATSHRERFGSFGIVVSWEWALDHDAQRVVYVDTGGPVAVQFAWLFQFALQEFEKASGGDPDKHALENKALASFARSTLWSRLLTLYEYMEPETNSDQVEWRIVNTLPQYHGAATRAELVRELLQMVERWRNAGSVRFEPNDIEAFVCRRGAESELLSELPDEFQSIPLLTYRERSGTSRFVQLHDAAMRRYRARERVVCVAEEPPHDTIQLFRTSDSAYWLPRVEHIEGARLSQDELSSWCHVLVQYTAVTGQWCDLFMSIGQALHLHNLLRELQWRSGLDPLNPLDEHNRPRQVILGRFRIGPTRSSRGEGDIGFNLHPVQRCPPM